jgi:hypothetical protein
MASGGQYKQLPKGVRMAMTIDAIVDKVFTDLSETREGQEGVGEIDEIVKRLNKVADARRGKRAALRTRPACRFREHNTSQERHLARLRASSWR